MTEFKEPHSFPEVDAVREERAALTTESRRLTETRSKHSQKLESAKAAVESTQKDYQRALADYTAGKLSEKEASEALEQREAAQRAMRLAQDSLAALDAQRAELAARLQDFGGQFEHTYRRAATAWFRGEWPELERTVLSAMEDCLVGIMLAGKEFDESVYLVGQLSAKVAEAAARRYGIARQRILTGKEEEAKNREAA